MSFSEIKSLKLVEIENVDKFVHFIFYFVLTALVYIYLINKYIKSQAIVYAIVFCVFYGMIIEVLQEAITVNRKMELLDVLYNCSGVLIASLLIVKCSKCFKK